jgi:hypothetical protein
MLRKIEVSKRNRVTSEKKEILPGQVTAWIREGDMISVTKEGYDYTQEFLVDLVFGQYLSSRLCTHEVFKECLAHIFTEDDLYNYIEHGGIEMWVNKKRKGLLDD